MLRMLISGLILVAIALPVVADDHGENDVKSGLERYVIDTRGSHAFIQFRISHLGFSWLYGRFNEFAGYFHFDPDDTVNSAVEITIQTASVDSNHERRDNHLRDDDFLTVEKFPTAHFRSTAFRHIEGEQYELTGDFTLLGHTRSLTIAVEHIGAGTDPWGGYRRGFSGKTSFKLADFGIDYDLGPDAEVVEIILDVEGVRKD